MDMKRKRRKPANQEAQVPAWVLDDATKPRKPLTKKELDDLDANVQAGIEDTPVWRDYVRRFGKKEAARILKVGIFSSHVVKGDPNN
jgi:hypothetical protein